MLSESFINKHDVKSVNIISESSMNSLIIIQFKDTKIINEYIKVMDFDKIEEYAKKIILKYSIYKQRKNKLKKIINNYK